MRLEELTVENCRNIAGATLRPDTGLTVIAGDNGQGKTNLMECIFLLTGSKSFRNSRDIDLVRRGATVGRVLGECASGGVAETDPLTQEQDTGPPVPQPDEREGGGRHSSIQVWMEGPEGTRRGRYAKVNGVDYGRAGAIAGIFTAVVFEPNHLTLVKGGPEGRRRFLDAALCQLYPGYLAILRRFNRALTQKNALLKKYHYSRDADALLDAFDTELAGTGSEITRRRAAYLDKAAPLAAKVYDELSNGAERLEITFSPTGAGPADSDGHKAGSLAEKATDAAGFGGGDIPEDEPPPEPPDAGLTPQAQRYAVLLRNSRRADIAAGFSTTGPQREDFEVRLGGQSARIFGSQGQQRSAVLSLKLAEAGVAETVCGEHPVLLLDDVLSELDEGRQAYLLGRMAGRQSFVTTCDATAFSRTAGKVVRMAKGELWEC